MKLDMTKRLERLLGQFRAGEIDRRRFLSLTAAAAATAGISTGWSRRALAATGEVRFDGWGGVVQEALHNNAFVPFTQKTGVKVVEGTFGDEIDILTKVKAGNPGDYNVIHSSGVDWYKRYIDLGWGSVLNESNIPNLKLVMTALIDPYRKITPAGLSAAPYDYGTTGIAYNTKYITKEEAEKLGVKLLIDPRFKGKIGAVNEMQTRVWYGALQSGQNPNDIKDIDAVWAKARDGRDLVKKYWESGAELMDLLSKEEIIVTEGWSGRIAKLQQQGAPIAYMDPPGGLAWMEDMLVLKGSPMGDCEQLLNFMLEPAVAVAVAEGQNYPPSLDPTKVQLSDKVKALPAFDPTGTLKGLTFADPVYWGSKFDEWEKQWDRIAKGA
ncbi:MAG TPA: extracellular solute-binding protein [Verrucomicrobiae bacterium]|nr:extracellular solute-binding protein [Verrucomicrobiae bacterium]